MTTEEKTHPIQPDSHRVCLMCGSDNPWSMKLDFQTGPDRTVHAVFQARETLQGYTGVLHGGVISALLDAAMTHCLFHQGVQAVTAELQVRFLKPVPWNLAIELTAKVEDPNPLLYRMYAELKQHGVVLAWARGKFIKRRA